MKRLRKISQILLVSVSIFLLAVNPAAACRLLCNRCCCCPCPSITCTTPAPSKATPPDEPSPSDAPPGATRDSSGVPSSAQAAEASTIDASQTAPHSDLPRGAATLTFGEAARETPAAPGLGRPRQQTIVEPTNLAVVDLTESRPPADITPPPAEVTPLPVGISPVIPLTSSALDLPVPLPTTLRPAARIESLSSAAEAAEHKPAPLGRPAEIEPARTSANRREKDAPLPPASSPAKAASRSPAAPVAAKPLAPVNAPVFSTVDDDPFAPLAPANVAQPADDDPFAPLPAQQQPHAKPTAPIAAEPTALRIVDALVPGADGRLPVRNWSDNSGRFQVKAKLVLIEGDKVRLLKETGRTTTVPVERLSASDRAYVAEVIIRYGQDLTKLDQLAAR